jgi:branched-chain amino acid transport system ATP-binding protein
MNALLEVRGIAKAYGGVQAVNDVSFDLNQGELLAFIGPNGAGKSTCFNMLNGQIAPDRGTVRLQGRDLRGMPPRAIWRLGVGRTFQITATFTSMTVAENVALALGSVAGRLWRLWGGIDVGSAEVARLLALVGMGGQADRSTAELAYGDLKRLELAIALGNRPKLLLMDEPTAGMAPKDRVDLMRLTAEIARAEGIGVLFTEHDMDVVFQHADRVMVLNRGQLIASGDPAVVKADPQVQAIYLGEGLTFDPAHRGPAEVTA